MANRNRYYCIMGIDHESQSWDPSIPYVIEARLYDISSGQMVGNTNLRLKEHGQNNLEEYFDKWTHGVTKSKCYQYMIFPGVNAKSSDICRILINRAPTLSVRNYASGHHSKMTIFDKGDIHWKVLPTTLYDFSFSTDSDENFKEFEKFCDFMIQEVGLVDFCKHYQTAAKCLRKDLILDESSYTADCNPIPASACILENDFKMNSGGRAVSKFPYESMHVIGVDVNSLYTQVFIEDKFSNTQLRKVTPVKGYDYREPWVWETYIKTTAKMFGDDNLQMRIICDIDDAVIKDVKDPLRLHDTKAVKHMAPSIRKYSTSHTRFSGTMMFFASEIVEFCKKYSIKSLKPRLILASFCSRFSTKLREQAFQLFYDSKNKKSDPHLAASAKIKKNALPGIYQQNPANYAHQQRDYEALNDEVYGLLQSARGKKKYTNVLAGAELTLHGRERHKKIQEFFESEGWEVVYGATDSLYLLVTSETDRQGILDSIKKFNRINYRRLKHYCRSFSSWHDMSPDVALGGLKVEHDGMIIHGGLNNIFKADKHGNITGASLSGYNWYDIVNKGNIKNIRELYEGFTVKDVYQKCNNILPQMGEWVF